jgi:hypothetical protein
VATKAEQRWSRLFELDIRSKDDQTNTGRILPHKSEEMMKVQFDAEMRISYIWK